MALKRKIGSTGLQRRVRPRREDDWEVDAEDSQASSSGDDEVEERSTRRHNQDDDDDDDDDDGSDNETGSEPGSEDDEDDDQEESAPKIDLSSVSFGALAKAQASLPPSKRKSKTTTTANTTAEEDDRRQSLSARKSSTTSRSAKDDSKLKRSSKHAPQEQSSKRPVSRRREFMADENPRRQYRDPRFDPLVGRLDEEKAKKNYAFLDEYREKELADLRAQVKKTKNPEEKEALKREVLSIESKKKSRQRKEEAQNLLNEHRKREKELVAQGKTPFYLKKSEQKKQLLVDRYASMSKGQVDRAIERKRKKVAGKEKKELGSLQRRSRD
ncbi:hypothetical protein BGZ63DRAFT_404025 [Mariannaea sp. PMI_226]|nr:hypothetical protein BGZ63DRAFT_404025 [Mariannaea sp. PMI_226]